MIKSLLYLSLFALLLNSCNSKNMQADNDMHQNKMGDQKKDLAKNKCKTLLIIAEDRSGSTGSNRKLKATDYKKLLESFENNSYGEVAIRVIGNPAPSEREFYLLDLEPYKEHKKIDPGLLMSEKARIIKQNKKIDRQNKKIKKQNKQRIKQFIQEKVKSHIIDYHPYLNKDITDIQDALQHIEKKINEPTFDDYEKIQVLIISDGKHDAYRLKTPLHFQAKRPIELYLIGWKDAKVFKDVQDIKNFESAEGFMKYYEKQVCK